MRRRPKIQPFQRLGRYHRGRSLLSPPVTTNDHSSFARAPLNLPSQAFSGLNPNLAKPGQASPKTIQDKGSAFLGFPCPNRAFSMGCAGPLAPKVLGSFL